CASEDDANVAACACDRARARVPNSGDQVEGTQNVVGVAGLRVEFEYHIFAGAVQRTDAQDKGRRIILDNPTDGTDRALVVGSGHREVVGAEIQRHGEVQGRIGAAVVADGHRRRAIQLVTNLDDIVVAPGQHRTGESQLVGIGAVGDGKVKPQAVS